MPGLERRGALRALATAPLLMPAAMMHNASTAATSAPATPVQLFPLHTVRLTGGPLHAAQQRNLATLMVLEPSRLLAPFRREAGLPLRAQPYDSWESQGLDGHMGGHVLSALALAVAATGDEHARQRLLALLAELQTCQDALAADPLMAGYLGGIPDGAALWRQLAAGTVQADNFSLNGRWVPWYNVHKTLAGLRDTALEARLPQAWPMLLALVDWVDRVTAPLSEAQMQAMLRTEHGGLAEVLADVHAHSGEPRHAALARRFVHQAIYQPLAAQQDMLTGLHANTQIPKVMGLLRVAEVAPAQLPQGLDAARFFWQQVVQQRSVAIGGNSVKEHFHSSADFSAMLAEVEGPESCNTYNMLKLSAALFSHAPDERYAAYAERALFNHVLSAQHPRSGGLVYFTPMRAGHYRVYSQAQQGMWCCVGSGLETHSRHGELVYAHSADALWVNLFVPSVLDAPAQGLRISQSTAFPDGEQVSLRLQGLAARTLQLRHPQWVAAGALQVWRNGRPVAVTSQPGSYLPLPGPWADGDTVRLQLPMQPHLEALPAPLADGRQAHALLLGPIVLAARSASPAGETAAAHLGDAGRMAHIASGPLAPEAATLTLDQPQRLLATLQAVPGQPLHRRTRALQTAGAAADDPAAAAIELQPFFRLHEARYQVYWPEPPRPPTAEQQARQADEATQQQALAARTIDSVAPGEQQPEVEHGYQAEGGDTGLNAGRRWRHATGWLAYTLLDPQAQARTLRLGLARGDAQRRFTLALNGRHLPLALRPDAPDEFYTLDLPLPADLPRTPDGRLQLRLVAEPGSVAGGLYELRLLRD